MWMCVVWSLLILKAVDGILKQALYFNATYTTTRAYLCVLCSSFLLSSPLLYCQQQEQGDKKRVHILHIIYLIWMKNVLQEEETVLKDFD